MTTDEQQQLSAAMLYMERQVGNLAREGAERAMVAESLAIKLKAAEARIAELTPAQADNVVPMKEPA